MHEPHYHYRPYEYSYLTYLCERCGKKHFLREKIQSTKFLEPSLARKTIRMTEEKERKSEANPQRGGYCDSCRYKILTEEYGMIKGISLYILGNINR